MKNVIYFLFESKFNDSPNKVSNFAKSIKNEKWVVFIKKCLAYLSVRIVILPGETASARIRR